jgi:RNA recognition motif. (a.k.a. RRM, RBD, or RNP domain)
LGWIRDVFYFPQTYSAVPTVSRAIRAEFARGDGRVKRKEDERRKNIAPSDTLFVVNFHEETTKKEDLEMLFEPFGKLVRIDLKRNYAFVQFHTIAEATAAKEATNGGKLDQSVLTVEYVARQREKDNHDRNNNTSSISGHRQRGNNDRDRGNMNNMGNNSNNNDRGRIHDRGLPPVGGGRDRYYDDRGRGGGGGGGAGIGGGSIGRSTLEYDRDIRGRSDYARGGGISSSAYMDDRGAGGGGRSSVTDDRYVRRGGRESPPPYRGGGIGSSRTGRSRSRSPPPYRGRSPPPPLPPPPARGRYSDDHLDIDYRGGGGGMGGSRMNDLRNRSPPPPPLPPQSSLDYPPSRGGRGPSPDRYRSNDRDHHRGYRG